MIKKILIVLSFLPILYLPFIAGSCDVLLGCEYRAGAKGYNEIVQISEQGNTMKRQKLDSYPIKEQVEIYLYSQSCRQDARIRAYFTKDGDNKKIPYIVDRINTAETMMGKIQLMAALNDINNNCHCITKDSGIIDTLESIGREINEAKSVPDIYKEEYNMYLKSLKEQIDKQNSVQ